MMTLFALILSIGIVVDDAIVIVENASTISSKGFPPKEATIKAMQEMTGPVMGITLVLTAVFLPAAFLPGITGQLFRQFALVIAATAIISAINALTLKPAQCALWLRPHGEKKPKYFFGASIGFMASCEGPYVGLVSRMVHAAYLMLLVFIIIIAVSGWRFAPIPPVSYPPKTRGMPSSSPGSRRGLPAPGAGRWPRKSATFLRKPKASKPGLPSAAFPFLIRQRLQLSSLPLWSMTIGISAVLP